MKPPLTRPLRIIYAAADGAVRKNSFRRFHWLQKLGHDVELLSVGLPYTRRLDPRRFLQLRWMRGPSLTRINRMFVDACLVRKPNLVWIDKGLLIFPESLKIIKRKLDVLLVSYVNDTPFTLRRQERRLWRFFKESIPLYDVHMVSQRFQIQQFLNAGAKRVFRFMHGIDPEIHCPQPDALAAPGTKNSLLFFGNCEPDRVSLAEELLRVFGPRLKVLGPNWGRFATPDLKRSGCLGPALYGEGYAASIRAADVALGLLSLSNQDQITRRSYEIPGCGGAFLGQRTPEHLELLREEKEALFFSNRKELIEKAESLLGDEDRINAIKAKGFLRSKELGFGYDKCIPRWLEFIFSGKRQGDELADVTAKERQSAVQGKPALFESAP